MNGKVAERGRESEDLPGLGILPVAWRHWLGWILRIKMGNPRVDFFGPGFFLPAAPETKLPEAVLNVPTGYLNAVG